LFGISKVTYHAIACIRFVCLQRYVAGGGWRKFSRGIQTPRIQLADAQCQTSWNVEEMSSCSVEKPSYCDAQSQTNSSDDHQSDDSEVEEEETEQDSEADSGDDDPNWHYSDCDDWSADECESDSSCKEELIGDGPADYVRERKFVVFQSYLTQLLCVACRTSYRLLGRARGTFGIVLG